MYRLLIVDDEAIIANGLYEVFKNIRHLDLDVYKAYSGKKALDLLNKTRMDIVLTDIRMPGIDGLQLLEMIHKRWPQCKVIFLTGYDEFEYAYTAIQYGGVNYILKTEGYDKVIETVECVIREIEEDLKSVELLQMAQKQLEKTKKLLQKDYFNGILEGNVLQHEINQQQFDELDIPFRADQDVIMLLGHIDNKLPKQINYSEKSKLLYSIKLVAEQYFSRNMSYVYFINKNVNLIWLIQPNKREIDRGKTKNKCWDSILIFIKGNLELVQAACKEKLDISLSFALDDSPSTWKEIGDRFLTLEMLLNYRIGRGSQILLTNKKVMEKDLQQWIDSSIKNLNIQSNEVQRLADYLEYGQKDNFFYIFDHITDHLKDISNIYYPPAQNLYYSIALVLFSHINRWNLMDRVAVDIKIPRLMQPATHKTWDAAIKYLKKLADVLFEIQNFEEEKRARDAIGIVKRHIDENIHDPDEISLVKLADVVYFNPSYLSRLFKEVEGVNLSDYITKVKVDKSKHLLENLDIKIYEVAEAVGYNSSSNFGRFFKKVTNMTPQEYREFWLNNQQMNRM